MESFEKANEGIIEVISVDTTARKNKTTVRRHKINAVPTLILLKDGVEIARSRGMNPPTHAGIRLWVSKFVPGVK